MYHEENFSYYSSIIMSIQFQPCFVTIYWGVSYLDTHRTDRSRFSGSPTTCTLNKWWLARFSAGLSLFLFLILTDQGSMSPVGGKLLFTTRFIINWLVAASLRFFMQSCNPIPIIFYFLHEFINLISTTTISASTISIFLLAFIAYGCMLPPLLPR